MTAISIIIPTTATPERLVTLERTLGSIAPQAEPGDEVVIVVDTADGREAGARASAWLGGNPTGAALVRLYTPPAERHTWGHQQINHGIAVARRGWLAFQDDDDIYLPGALDAVRAAIRGLLAVPRPLLFRFISTHRETGEKTVVWRRTRIERGNVGGHSIVTPKLTERLGHWGYAYDGDYDFIRETVDRWKGDVQWHRDILTLTRP